MFHFVLFTLIDGKAKQFPPSNNSLHAQEKVYNAPSSTNTDKPEGTLEALMQVASCSREVGWRKEALKVAVVFTDAGFHLAGDGRVLFSFSLMTVCVSTHSICTL